MLDIFRKPETVTGYIGSLLLFSAFLSALAALSAFLQPGIQYAPAWPATPVGFAIMWLFGIRWWPAIAVANAVLIALRADPASVPIVTIVAVMEVVIALGVLRMMQILHVRPDFSRVRDIAWFGGSVLAVSLIAVPIFLLVTPFFDGSGYRVMLYSGTNYWLSETLSFLVFTPLVTAWRSSWYENRSQRRVFALSLLGLFASGFAVWIFGDVTGYNIMFLLLPFVAACGLTGGVAGAGLGSVIVTMVLIAIAQQDSPSFTEAVLRMMFTATTVLTGYMLAALFTEKERIRRKLEYRARHDSLTGLQNRYEFERSLHEMYGQDKGREHALLYLDLDQFKLVNDTCGHIAGDRMLMQLSGRLRENLPPGVQLARLGGDEFGCLLEDASAEQAMEVANMLESVVREFRFVMGELQFNLGVSIGVTLFPAGDADSPEHALGRADVACYTAKEAGRSRSHLYRPQDESMLTLHAGIQEVSQLQAALEQGRFMLFQQPIARISGESPEIVAYEILLRMQGDNGPVSPTEFLPVAQRYGLIEQIDRWVLMQASEFLGSCGDEALKLNVNVSGLSASSTEFFKLVMSLPERFGFQPQQLALEITESIAIDRLEQMTPSLLMLRERGFGIVLDDFGSGVASFGYLGDLPVTEVKLDGRFVRDLGSDPAADLVIESLTRLAELRGIRCVAEWVETAGDIERLRSLGVSYGQGYAIAYPAPIEELREKIRNR